jgi:hypothetical protein
LFDLLLLLLLLLESFFKIFLFFTIIIILATSSWKTATASLLFRLSYCRSASAAGSRISASCLAAEFLVSLEFFICDGFELLGCGFMDAAVACCRPAIRSPFLFPYFPSKKTSFEDDDAGRRFIELFAFRFEAGTKLLLLISASSTAGAALAGRSTLKLPRDELEGCSRFASCASFVRFWNLELELEDFDLGSNDCGT